MNAAVLNLSSGVIFFLLAALWSTSANVLPSSGRFVGNPCRLPSGVRGKCTLITDCPDALAAVWRGVRRGTQGTLDRCGFQGNVEVVCCNAKTVVGGPRNPGDRRPGGAGFPLPGTRKPVAEWVGRPPKIDKHSNALTERKSTIACRMYAEKCPKTVSPYIVGGTVAENGEFPHMVALGYPISRNGMNTSWLCGGTLISDRYVMTAAHCALLSSKKPIVARLGELDLSTDEDGANPVNYEIEQVETHPDFVSNARYHDLALIRLKEPVTFTQFICPACLYSIDGRADAAIGGDRNELTDRILTNGEEIGPRINDEVDLRKRQLIVSGWGSEEFLGDSSPILRKAVIKPYSIEECNNTLTLAAGTPRTALMPRGLNPSAMLCAGDRKGNNDTCQGDSGGPLQFQDNDSPLYTVVGITSFGDKCGSPLPAVYTRVSTYLSWIENKVW